MAYNQHQCEWRFFLHNMVALHLTDVISPAVATKKIWSSYLCLSSAIQQLPTSIEYVDRKIGPIFLQVSLMLCTALVGGGRLNQKTLVHLLHCEINEILSDFFFFF